jgi:hypothetical protein
MTIPILFDLLNKSIDLLIYNLHNNQNLKAQNEFLDRPNFYFLTLPPQLSTNKLYANGNVNFK